ncbi:MAG TPA: hypothetical protein DIT94_15745 [Deltaproteobacteria bacterium]|nr:hypothetical protein [Deltaproteobacteria bacterium]
MVHHQGWIIPSQIPLLNGIPGLNTYAILVAPSAYCSKSFEKHVFPYPGTLQNRSFECLGKKIL